MQKSLADMVNSEHGWKKGLQNESIGKAESIINFVKARGFLEKATTVSPDPKVEKEHSASNGAIPEGATTEKPGDDTDLRADETTAEDIQGNE